LTIHTGGRIGSSIGSRLQLWLEETVKIWPKSSEISPDPTTTKKLNTLSETIRNKKKNKSSKIYKEESYLPQAKCREMDLMN
jgi:hypothetical protein